MRGIVVASENWRETGRFPLPAKFLLEAGRLVAEQRHGIRFRLISNWAINKKNRPATEFERNGLTEILLNTNRPYYGRHHRGWDPLLASTVSGQGSLSDMRRLS